MPRTIVLTERDEKEPLKVSAGILCDRKRRILITERVGDIRFDGLWEFPGGKLGPRESAEIALCRELAEELGIQVLNHRYFMSLDHDYPDRRVAIDFFLVDSWQGKPKGLLGQGLRWLAPADLTAAELLPADEPVLEALQRLHK